MGLIPQGPLTVDGSEEEIVYALDPDVTVPPDLAGAGWIPANRCECARGADKIQARILGSGEMRTHRGIVAELPTRGGGELGGYHYALMTAVLSVNGKRKDIRSNGKTYATIGAYLDALMAANASESMSGSVAYQLLALRILTRSNSKAISDYYALARLWLGVEADTEKPGEVADAGASKSDELTA